MISFPLIQWFQSEKLARGENSRVQRYSTERLHGHLNRRVLESNISDVNELDMLWTGYPPNNHMTFLVNYR